MEQLRDALRKLTEDYKDLEGPGATREQQQSKIAHESSWEELKQIKTILEKLTRDHEKLRVREAVQGTPSRSKEAARPIGPSAESRVDNKKANGSRDKHTAMHVDVQDQESSGSAIDSVHSDEDSEASRG
jgi:hypothetical protein